METFGQRVRQAVESKGLPLDEVAKAIGLSIEHVQALGRDDFGALPGDDIITEGLRSFARLVDVDPDEVIADYRRERQRWLAAIPDEVEVAGMRDARDEPEAIESPRPPGEAHAVEPSKPRSGRTGRMAILASVILALPAVAFLLWSRSSTSPESGQPAAARDRASMSDAAEKRRDLPGAPAGVAVSATDTPPRPADPMEPTLAIEQPDDASGLSIREHGVGRRVARHELVGEAERFTEGKRVWYWTLIEGGSASESIDHVWIHEGEEVRRVRLKVGGSRWRTSSYKELSPGSEGSWAVEARDDAGRVLARREFLCSPRTAR